MTFLSYLHSMILKHTKRAIVRVSHSHCLHVQKYNGIENECFTCKYEIICTVKYLVHCLHVTHWNQKLFIPSQLKATRVPEKKNKKKENILISHHHFEFKPWYLIGFCFKWSRVYLLLSRINHISRTSTQVYNPGRATFDCNV